MNLFIVPKHFGYLLQCIVFTASVCFPFPCIFPWASAECGDAALDQVNMREYNQVLFICVFLYQTIFPTKQTKSLELKERP